MRDNFPPPYVCLALLASEADRLRDARNANFDPFGSSSEDRLVSPLRFVALGVGDHRSFFFASFLVPALVCLEREVCLSSEGFLFKDMLSKSLLDSLSKLLIDSLSRSSLLVEGVRLLVGFGEREDRFLVFAFSRVLRSNSRFTEDAGDCAGALLDPSTFELERSMPCKEE